MTGQVLDASWLFGGPRLPHFFSDIYTETEWDPPGLAVSMAANVATLTWSASPTAGVTSYDLYRRSPATGAVFVPGSDTPVATNVTSPYADTGLSSGTYEWQVFGNVGTAYSGYGGYFAEYDTSNAASITASGSPLLVSQLNDLGPNGYNLTQATGASQPTTGSTTIGGLNALAYNGSRLSVDIPDKTGPFTIYFVVQSNVGSDSSPTKYEILGGDPTFGGLSIGHQFDEWVADGSSTIESFIGVDTSAHIVGVVFNGASSVIFVDSTEVTGTTGTAILNKIHLGSRGNDAAPFNGAIGHSLFYEAAHDATTRGNVRTALKAQWSIP